MSEKKMAKWKKWALGIALILGALATAAVAVLDDDPDTKINIRETIDGVQDGVEVIRDEEEAPAE